MNSEKKIYLLQQNAKDKKTNLRLDQRPVGKKNSKLRDVLKTPAGNETSRPIKNTSEISRSCQNCPKPTFFEVPFYTPSLGQPYSLIRTNSLPPSSPMQKGFKEKK